MQKVKKGSTRNRTKSARELAEENMAFVFWFVRKYYPGYPRLHEDLIAAGNVGLTVAASRFEPQRGLEFSTYAHFWVRNYVAREFDSLSFNGMTGLSNYRRRNLRIPQVAPISSESPASLPADPESCASNEAVDIQEAAQAIIDRMDQLPERTREILKQRLLDSETLEAIGNRFGLSKERIRQIIRDSLSRLRRELQWIHHSVAEEAS